MILVASQHGFEKNERGRPNALSTTFRTARFRRHSSTSSNSPSDSSGSTVEKEVGVGFLGQRGLWADSRGWEGWCVWDLVPLSQRCPGIPLSPRPLIGLEFWAKV